MKEITLIAGGIVLGWWICSTKKESKELKEQNSALKSLEQDILNLKKEVK